MDYFNSNIVERHDNIMTLNGWMVEHFNFVRSMPWLSDEEQESLKDEMSMYLCYDV